ncbi:VRR-NUC domain-containing protein [Henriciella sp.]|uniref:VRR-NUC domain-containing protein n=1 Tax=Henriciella sp. TaxID=1968823 RepID=UPI002613EAB2|nr:VRR-NUC domain-containing protein [Henriciella sp.]
MKHEEHQIQCAIVDLLEVALPADATFWAVPNGEKRGGKKINVKGKLVPLSAIRLKKEGVKPGVADIHILWRGCLVCLEVKTGAGRQSKSQKEWADAITTSGGVYHIVRSVDDARGFLAGLIPTFKAQGVAA